MQIIGLGQDTLVWQSKEDDQFGILELQINPRDFIYEEEDIILGRIDDKFALWGEIDSRGDIEEIWEEGIKKEFVGGWRKKEPRWEIESFIRYS